MSGKIKLVVETWYDWGTGKQSTKTHGRIHIDGHVVLEHTWYIYVDPVQAKADLEKMLADKLKKVLENVDSS